MGSVTCRSAILQAIDLGSWIISLDRRGRRITGTSGDRCVSIRARSLPMVFALTSFFRCTVDSSRQTPNLRRHGSRLNFAEFEKKKHIRLAQVSFLGRISGVTERVQSRISLHSDSSGLITLHGQWHFHTQASFLGQFPVQLEWNRRNEFRIQSHGKEVLAWDWLGFVIFNNFIA